MNSTVHLTQINRLHAIFAAEIEQASSLGLSDIHRWAEKFLVPILNTLYSTNLEHLDSKYGTPYPAIDLADYEKKIAFQVTAEREPQKIRDTIDKYIKNGFHKQFNSLKFILLKEKRNYRGSTFQFAGANTIHFSPAEDIIDRNDLLKEIGKLVDPKAVERVAEAYFAQFGNLPQYGQSLESELEEWEIIQEMFDFALSQISFDAPPSIDNNRHLKLITKIDRNFSTLPERKEIKREFHNTYRHRYSIEQFIRQRPDQEARDLFRWVQTNYKEQKNEGYSEDPIQSYKILNSLAQPFIPLARRKNGTYQSIAISLILYVFEICEIGSQDPQELSYQTSLFS